MVKFKGSLKSFFFKHRNRCRISLCGRNAIKWLTKSLKWKWKWKNFILSAPFSRLTLFSDFDLIIQRNASLNSTSISLPSKWQCKDGVAVISSFSNSTTHKKTPTFDARSHLEIPFDYLTDVMSIVMIAMTMMKVFHVERYS